jgi:hypothetical protein
LCVLNQKKALDQVEGEKCDASFWATREIQDLYSAPMPRPLNGTYLIWSLLSMMTATPVKKYGQCLEAGSWNL